MKMIFGFFRLISFASLILLAACNSSSDSPAPQAARTITQLVIDDPNLSYLEAAVIRAGAVEDIAGLLSSSTANGFTVFAPTNQAFQQLGFNSEAAVSAADAAVLRDILRYHVLAARVSAAQVVTGAQGTALAGRDIFLRKDGANVFINPANPNFTAASVSSLTNAQNQPLLPLGTTGNIQVTTADVQASNGVVHVVNRVLLPPPTVETMARAYAAQTAPNTQFSQLVASLVRPGVALAPNGPLNGTGPFTVFAPTDAAFGGLAGTTIGSNDAQLSTVLRYHVYSGKVYSNQLSAGNITMLAGGVLGIITSPSPQLDPNGSVNNVSLGNLPLDVVCSNGVIHVINTVLLPTL